MAWWCASSSPLDGASAATSSPRNDLVKNYRVHPTLVDFHTGYGTLEKLLGAWRAKLAGRRPSFPDGLASSFRRLNTAVNQYFATPQLSYLVGSACACRRGQLRLRVLCTESLRHDLPALAAELGARASHRHSNLRTTRRPRRNATATVSAETAAWLRDMYREDVALHKYYCS